MGRPPRGGAKPPGSRPPRRRNGKAAPERKGLQGGKDANDATHSAAHGRPHHATTSHHSSRTATAQPGPASSAKRAVIVADKSGATGSDGLAVARPPTSAARSPLLHSGKSPSVAAAGDTATLVPGVLLAASTIPVLSAPAAPTVSAAAFAVADHGAETPPARIDVEAFTRNLGRLIEEGGRAIAAYLKPVEAGGRSGEYADEIADAAATLAQVMEFWYADPQRVIEMQSRLGKSYLDLVASTARRLAGEASAPVAKPDPADKRFADPEWSSNQYFDFLKQAYLVTADWAKNLVADAAKLDATTRQKADFYMRQIVNAMAPSNFIFTNPELWRATLNENGENLVRGAQMLAEDIEAGHGELKIRQSDLSKFEVGRDIATTPGKVVHQNALMQLIQYAPSTERVLKRPLLMVPPWINKFYILDLAPEKSFIKWCIDHGLTVFVISWVNPDAQLAGKSFADYMREGPLEAIDVITRITGETKVNVLGYCVGGTLLASTLAYLAALGDDRTGCATLLATQVDFTYAGDLKVFAATEPQVEAIERRMAARGYLEGAKMANAFNLLRSNDLIWPYVVSTYIKGEAPLPFDLLHWNADATRMPAANHSFYLRNCYLENKLARGKMQLDNVTIDLRRVTVPIYNLATREDHIAPAKSVYVGSSCFGGPVRFVLSGSGHIAGVINAPNRNKYQYWTNGPPQGDDLDAWIGAATLHPGSWWNDWIEWVTAQDTQQVPARMPGGGELAPIENAPGSYVKVKS